MQTVPAGSVFPQALADSLGVMTLCVKEGTSPLTVLLSPRILPVHSPLTLPAGPLILTVCVPLPVVSPYPSGMSPDPAIVSPNPATAFPDPASVFALSR